MSKEKILVVEDAPDISSLLKIYFTSQGYEVMTAMRGQVALDLCRKAPPNLALLDVNLPDMEGYDIGRTLRQSARTRHIPIIFLTARGERQDRLKALGEVQAEYYIVKPFDIEEVHTIVKGALDRARQKNLAHPVTNLPTAELINDQYRALLAGSGWALAQLHINGFKTFTHAYGAVVGEDVLKFTALLLSEVVNELGGDDDFIGQMVVGPDFIVTTTPEHLRAICEKLIERFDAEIGLHYNYKDRRNGYIVVNDDAGNPRQRPLMSLSIGVLNNEDGPFYDIRELSETVEEVRLQALVEAHELGRKSHWIIGRDRTIDRKRRVDIAIDDEDLYRRITLSQTQSDEWSRLIDCYEQALKLRNIRYETIKSRRDDEGELICAEIDRLTITLNHELKLEFGKLRDIIIALSKKTLSYKILSWINQQYEVCDAWRRSIVECGSGHMSEKEVVDVGIWLNDYLILLRTQLNLPLKIDTTELQKMQRVEIDTSMLRVACLHLFLSVYTAGARKLYIKSTSSSASPVVTIVFEDTGDSQQRLKVLRSIMKTRSYAFDSESYQGLALLWRMLYLQDIGVNCKRHGSSFQMIWRIPRLKRKQRTESMPLEELKLAVSQIIVMVCR